VKRTRPPAHRIGMAALLRRRTSEILWHVLASCQLVGAVGGVLVFIREPAGSLIVAFVAFAAAAALDLLLGDGF